MRIALLTNYLTPYRVPVYRRLASRHELTVYLYGGGEAYVPPWYEGLDQPQTNVGFATVAVTEPRQAFLAARHHDAVIAPFAGGAMLPAAYAGARAHGKPFVLWASIWAQPRSVKHWLAMPATNHIFRNADAVLAYGEHVKRFVATVRGRDTDVFVAPQAVEPGLFAPTGSRESAMPPSAVLYVGRLVPEKGIKTLLSAWKQTSNRTTLVIAGDGPLRAQAEKTPDTVVIGVVARQRLPAVYRSASVLALPSIPTPRFREPWGLVVNEAMHSGVPVIASDAVGAAAGGLVVNEETGLVVPNRDAGALARAIDRAITDSALRQRITRGATRAIAGHTPQAMVDAFEQALAHAGARRGGDRQAPPAANPNRPIPRR